MMNKLIATLGIGATLAFAAPSTSQAQGPIVTGGLVNVTITDVANNVLRNVNVGVPVALGIAANVCGVSVDVISADLAPDGVATCTSTSGQTVTLTQKKRR